MMADGTFERSQPDIDRVLQHRTRQAVSVKDLDGEDAGWPAVDTI